MGMVLALVESYTDVFHDQQKAILLKGIQGLLYCEFSNIGDIYMAQSVPAYSRGPVSLLEKGSN